MRCRYLFFSIFRVRVALQPLGAPRPPCGDSRWRGPDCPVKGSTFVTSLVTPMKPASFRSSRLLFSFRVMSDSPDPLTKTHVPIGERDRSESGCATRNERDAGRQAEHDEGNQALASPSYRLVAMVDLQTGSIWHPQCTKSSQQQHSSDVEPG